MQTTGTNLVSLVGAARAGDRQALDELVTAHLPLVYAIVRRALDDHPDVDDVVQDVMVRVVRQLPDLHAPESFRAWLAAIAVRQVSTYLHRGSVAAERAAALDEAADVPDAAADIEGLTALRLELSAQRRQVVRASRWLDPDDRSLLSLWWLEVAGELTRTELASAIGVSVAHAGVRVQRMRNQLELSRSLVAALDAGPRCARLAAVVAEWDGVPDPLWRKRIARHTRDCPVCGGAAEGMVAAERLLVGFALLPVPVALTVALTGKGALTTAALSTGASGGVGAGVKAGLLGQLFQAVVAHPVAATVTAGALAAGAAVTATNWPEPEPPAPPVAAAPTSAPAAVAAPTSAPAPAQPGPAAASPSPAAPSASGSLPIAAGRVSLESVNAAGRFVAVTGDLGVLIAVGADSGGAARQQATFEVVPGLADAACFSFRAPDGRYLRHASWRLRLGQDEGTKLFRGDATFCVRADSATGSVALESSNYPGWFLRHRGDELWVDHSDGSAAFRADSAFRPRSPLA